MYSLPPLFVCLLWKLLISHPAFYKQGLELPRKHWNSGMELTVLEVWNQFNWAKNQGVFKSMFPLESLGRNLFPWLMASFSIFKASNIASCFTHHIIFYVKPSSVFLFYKNLSWHLRFSEIISRALNESHLRSLFFQTRYCYTFQRLGPKCVWGHYSATTPLDLNWPVC